MFHPFVDLFSRYQVRLFPYSEIDNNKKEKKRYVMKHILFRDSRVGKPNLNRWFYFSENSLMREYIEA